MNSYYYWDNAKGWHSKLAFACKANNILEADAKFKTALGADVTKMFTISCGDKPKTITPEVQAILSEAYTKFNYQEAT